MAKSTRAEHWSSSKRDPWDRIKGEATKAYAYFVYYRDLGPMRTIKRVAEDYDRSPTAIYDLCRKWDWRSRVAAWDDFLEEQSRADYIAGVREMRKKQALMGAMLQDVGVRALAELREHGALEPNEVLRFITEGAKLERVAVGEPEEHERERVRIDSRLDHDGQRDMAHRLLADPEAAELARAAMDKVAGRAPLQLPEEVVEAEVVEETETETEKTVLSRLHVVEDE